MYIFATILYFKLSKKLIKINYIFSTENVQYIDSHKGDLNLDFIGSWSVEVGDLDQALHLWQYNGGFQTIIKAHEFFANDQVHISLIS